MSFSIDYKTLRNRNFQTAMGKVLRHDDYPQIKTTYNISRMGDFISQEMRRSDEIMRKMFKRYAELDERGNPIKDGDGWLIKEGADKEAFEKEFEDYLAHSVTIERHKLDLETLEGVGLTPNELLSLSPILADVADGL